MAMPEQAAFSGTPASNIASEPPQTDAMEDEPLDSRMSDTILIVYGKMSSEGRSGERARLASAPCPISLLPGPLSGRTSPVE